MKKYTYEELQEFPVVALQNLKVEHHHRIAANESERQALIRDVMILQQIEDNSSWKAAPK